MKALTSLKKWGALTVLLFCSTIQAQTYQRATSQTNNNPIPLTPSRVFDAADAVDGSGQGDLSTYSRIRANSGVISGLAGYDGIQTLTFPSDVSAGTTTYIRIASTNNIVESLLGGSAVGSLLSTVLLGEQIITFDVLNSSNSIVATHNSNNLDSQNAKIVSNDVGEFFLAITPTSTYRSIRITNDLYAVAGLANTEEVYVYGAFYNTSISTCEGAKYTSWSGDGGLLNLDLTGNAGVNDPDHAIDSNFSNYSELVLPTVATAGSIQQTVYFDGASNETYQIRLSSTADVLNLNLADNIQIIGYNGTTQVSSVSLSTLLDLDLLGLFQSNEIITFPFTPGAAIDRVTIRVSSLANVSLTSSLRLYSVTRNSIELETGNATNIDTDGATLNASITNPACLETNGDYGFEYSTDPDFAQGAGTLVISTDLGTGTTFSYDLSGLNANETYYFRAFATADTGATTYTIYGELESFTTDIVTWNGSSWNNVDGPNVDGSDDVLIDGNYNYNSTMHDGGFAVDSLFINTGNILTINNNDDLEIFGNIDAADDNSIDAQEGIVSWLGSDTQVLDGNEFVANTINIVEVDKPDDIILEAFNEINIVDNFTITNGDLDLNENANLVFKSSATQTAIFGIVGDCANTNIFYSGTGASQGKATVERFIPAKRAFRGLTAPVNSTTTINDNWQEGAQNVVPDYSSNENPEPGYGTHITGNDPTNNGFDNTATDNPSLFTYDNDTQTWVTIINTDVNTFSIGYPYFMLVRGDRSINTQMNAPTPTNTTLRASGQLHLCDFSFPFQLADDAGQFNLIGNPYQSPVDMSLVLADATNVNPVLYQVFDPTINDNGAYTVIDVSDGSSVPASSANEYLQPGQSAFVYTANNGSASLTFSENHKYTLNTNDAVFRPANNSNTSIRIQLYKNQNELIDGTKINLGENFTFDNDYRDIIKSTNFDETFGIYNNNDVYAIVSEPAPETSRTYPLDIINYRETDYRFELELENTEGLEVYLKDNYLDQTIDASEFNFYDFSIDMDDASSNPDRFELFVMNQSLSNNKITTSKFMIYPNPVTGNSFEISSSEFSSNQVEVSIHSILGNQVYENEHLFSNTSIKIEPNETLNTGIYIVNITSDNKKYTQKLIVK